MTGDPDRTEQLAKIAVFRGLTPDEFRQLLGISREVTFESGQTIIEQGQTSQALWVLLEGACQVVRKTAHAGTAVLAELSPDDLFGEMSFFSPAPHSASVVATTRVTLLQLDRADYDALLHDDAAVAYKLAYNVVERVAKRLRTMDHRLAALADDCDEEPAENRPEWHRFRENLFGHWNL